MEREPKSEQPKEQARDLSEDFLTLTPSEFKEKLSELSGRKSLVLDFSDLTEVRERLLLNTLAAGQVQEVSIRATQEEHDSKPQLFNAFIKWEKK